jgi:hypothetical protein
LEIRVVIPPGGNPTVWAINLREDLLHDYVFFRKRAKKFDENDPKTIFLQKRYLRAALLLLFAYTEAVVNGWILHISKLRARPNDYKTKCRLPLVEKF